MSGLELVAKALIAVAAKPAAERLQRQERVVALLKKFKLAPNVPPRDFDGVYIYSLIEYCYGKPKPVIQFFRDKKVRDAFRESFETGDPSPLDREAEKIMSWTDETHDLRREFAGFTAVFNGLVDRTRGAAEARSDRRREEIAQDLQAQLAQLSDKLDAVSLDQIRTIAMAPAAGQLDPIGWLAHEAKAWFDTIGYGFESHRDPEQDSFTWIIKVPARRRYDRIVVYGTAGEAGKADVDHVQSLVTAQDADEGWVLVPRRVSTAARHTADATNGTIACYTLDELIDQDADFDPYLDWLEAEVKRRKIDTRYVPVYCRKDEHDPESGQTIASSVYGDDEGGLEGYALGWLNDPSKEHLSVLGEFGTGKSWFCLHLAWELAKEYRTAKKTGRPRPRLPLVIPLRDYAKAVSVESLFSEFFFRRHRLQLKDYSVFEYLNRAGRLLLIFDGFDEMASRVDRQRRIDNFWELAKAVVPGAKVLLTCRTEHFPEAKEGRELLGAQLKASTQALTGEPPQFEVAELQPFDDTQVRALLGHITEPATVDLIMGNSKLLDLMRRPVMSELVLDALPDLAAGKKVDVARVYLYAIRRKMARDIQAERTFTSMGDKLFFLCELSWEMLSTDTLSMNYRQFPDRIRRYFGAAVTEDKDLDHWNHDMQGQSMLIRNSDGDYSPAHKSLVEFFVAYKFAAELGLLNADFLTLVKEDTQSHGLTEQWSEHFLRTEPGATLRPIDGFAPESIERLAATFGRRQLSHAVIKLMPPMLDASRAIPTLQQLILWTRERATDYIAPFGGNAATLLVQLDATALRGMDLTGISLAWAELDLNGDPVVDLSNVDLRGAELFGSDLGNVCLVNTNLTGCDLTDVSYLGEDRNSPSGIALHPTRNDLFVATASGTLLRWRSANPNTDPETVFEIDDEIRNIGFAGVTDKIVLGFRRRDIVLDGEQATIDMELLGMGFNGILAQDGVQAIVTKDDSGGATIYSLSDGREIGRLDSHCAMLGHSSALDRAVFLDVATRELFTLRISSGVVKRTPCGSLEPEQIVSRGIHMAADRIWLRKFISSGSRSLEVHDINGTLITSLQLDHPYFHGNVATGTRVAGDPTADVAILCARGALRAYRMSTWEILWTELAPLDVTGIALTADCSHVITTNRYCEIAIISVDTGEVVSRTSISRNYRGARISRDCGLPPEVLDVLELGGAILVD